MKVFDSKSPGICLLVRTTFYEKIQFPAMTTFYEKFPTKSFSDLPPPFSDLPPPFSDLPPPYLTAGQKNAFFWPVSRVKKTTFLANSIVKWKQPELLIGNETVTKMCTRA